MKRKASTEVKVEVKEEVHQHVENGGCSVKRQVAPDSDSDDIPISGLAKRKKLKLEKKSEVKKEPNTKPSLKLRAKSTHAVTKKRIIKIKIRQQECTEELYETLKGRLAQELLCRWWYAIEWPPVKKLATKLHGVQELDGYPGAYIRVQGKDLGSIIDTRSSVGKPSLLHFLAMSSNELLKLLLQAYDKQIEVLIEHEGPITPLLKELQKARASAASISPNKADRGFRKVLKSYAELEREINEVEALALKDANEDNEVNENVADAAED